ERLRDAPAGTGRCVVRPEIGERSWEERTLCMECYARLSGPILLARALEHPRDEWPKQTEDSG
ncbi:MAG: hypothetical protein AB7P22_19750, partial [Vicinamibacterales bacterium]